MKQIVDLSKLALALVAVVTGTNASAVPGAIFAPTSGIINVGGPGFGAFNDTFNQIGLATAYVSGITSFDTYLASNPRHSTTFSPGEWFSNAGTTTAQVTYDFGALRTFDAFALWNEESSGIGRLDVLVSTNGTTFSALLTGLSPTDNNGLVDYGADRWNFSAVTARYVRLNMSACPQPNAGQTFPGCAIGEVAFREAGVIPEPATVMLFVAGLAGVAAFARRARAPA